MLKRYVSPAIAVLALVALGVVAGCKGPTPLHGQQYDATLAFTGDVQSAEPIPLGTVSRVFGLDVSPLALKLATIYLADSLEWKSCTIAPAVSSASGDGTIVVEATAACTLKGVPIVETLTLTLTPSPS